MKINFTKKQFETLLEMVQLGYCITASNDQMVDESKFAEMEQYLMSFAKEFDYEKVLYNPHEKNFGLTVESEQELQQVIDEYEEMVFWDKLVYYMARRDFKTEMTQQPLAEEAALQRLIDIEEKYHKYFEKNGVQYLKIEK